MLISRSEILGKTKTLKSARTFKMPMIVTKALDEWKTYCKEQGVASEFVFPTMRNTKRSKCGEMRKSSSLKLLLSRFLEKHNLKEERISLYTFRHTFATILLENREHPKIVAEMLGHADTKMVMEVYSHILSQDIFKQSVQTLDKVYSELGLEEDKKSA